MDEITTEIAALTIRLWVYRHVRRESNVVLEIKGLKAKAIKAAGHLDRLNSAYDKFNEAAPLHAADVEGLTPQIEGLAEDLQFAAQVLGNSAGAAGEPAGGVGQKPAVIPLPTLNQPERPPQAQQTVILDGQANMGDMNQPLMQMRAHDVQLIRS